MTNEQSCRGALERILAFVTDDERMTHWDSWRAYIANGGKASLPRDGFESLLDWIAEEAREALGTDEPRANPGDDILDELEARGDNLSRRAARYIRCKLAMLGEHPDRQAEPRASQPGFWVCAGCKGDNFPTDSTCAHCGGSRQAAPRSYPAIHSLGGWRCSCEQWNDFSNDVCKTCGRPRVNRPFEQTLPAPGKAASVEGYAAIEMPDGFKAEARAATQIEAGTLLLEQLKTHYGREFRLTDSDGTVICTTENRGAKP